MKKMMMLIGAALFGAVQAWGATVNCSTWAEVKTALGNGNSVKLTQDVSVGTSTGQAFRWTSSTAMDVSIDLSGHKIHAYNGSTTAGDNDRLFIFSGENTNFKLTINDSVGGGGIVGHQQLLEHGGGMIWIDGKSQLILNGGTISGFSTTGGGGLVWARYGSFTMNGGSISSCSAGGNGGAVYVEYGTFTMNGGTISSCSSTYSAGTPVSGDGGGGVYVASNGKFNLNGGTISGCTASQAGGGVLSHGAVKIDSGTITGSSATYHAGGVCVWAGTFTMNGGTISSCSAKWGGAFHQNAGTITINGGSFASNSATDWASVISKDDGTVTINGGVFTGNTGGKCVVNNNGGTTYLYGGVFDFQPFGTNASGYSNFRKNNGTISTGSYNESQVGSKWVVGKSVSSDSNNKLTAGTYTFDPAGSEYVASGCHIAPAKVATKSGSTWTIGSAATSPFQASTWNYAKINLEAGYSVKLTGNVSQDSQCDIPANKGELMLDLNGHTITRTASDRAFLVNNGNSFTIKNGTYDGANCQSVCNGLFIFNYFDKTTLENVTVRNCKNSGAKGAIYSNGTLIMKGGRIENCTSSDSNNGKGGAVYLSSGTFVMTNGAVIASCSSGNFGGGVYVSTGTFTLADGTISSCSTSGNGGAVYVSSGTFNMTGGTISSCSSTSTTDWNYGGGGVYVASSGTFNLNGGTISGCTASRAGGGVFSYGTVKIDGGTISGCTAKNAHGGGIAVWAGTFDMSGGTISSCSARWGGAFHQTAGTTTVNGGSFTGNTASEQGRVFNEEGGTVTINGGVYAETSGSASSVFHMGSSNFYLYGGVCDFQPSAKSTAITSWGGASETQVGSKWVIGKSVAFDANNKLTAGTYTFDPAKAEYAAAGVALAPGRFTEKTGDLAWQILTGTQIGDTTWGYVKNGACEIYGSGMVTNAAALKTLGVTNLVIVSGVTGIGANAFDGWSSIRDVSFGADCVTISSQAFLECWNLTNVAFAATGAASIGDHAFYRCNSLEKMSFVAKPTFGTQSYTLQAGIWMKDGLPQIYTIPDITVDGAIKKRVLATNSLAGEWTDVTDMSDEGRKAYHFFKIVIE